MVKGRRDVGPLVVLRRLGVGAGVLLAFISGGCLKGLSALLSYGNNNSLL